MNEPRAPYEADPLDAFEPEPVPRARLQVLGGLLFLLCLMLLSTHWGRRFRYYGFFGGWTITWLPLGGAAAALLCGLAVLYLAKAETSSVTPRGVGIRVSIAWGLGVAGLAMDLMSHLSVIGFLSFTMIVLIVGATPGLVLFPFARLGPGRAVLVALFPGGLGAAMFFLGLFGSGGEGDPTVRLAVAVAVLWLTISCFKVYRRQRRLEREFQQAMRDRDRR